MTVVAQTIEPRTFSGAVDRVIRSCGEASPGTVVNPSSHTINAMMAVNDAVEIIYNAARWPWREVHHEVAFSPQTMWYELPGDYDMMMSGPRYNSILGGLSYRPLEKLHHEHPELRAVPPGTSVSVVTTVQNLSNSYFGTPTIYTLSGTSVGFFMIPDEDFVEAQPKALLVYLRNPVEMVADNDIVDLPKNLWFAHHKLALGLYKQFMEYSDYGADIAVGNDKLSRQIASHSLLNTRYEGTISDINYNE